MVNFGFYLDAWQYCRTANISPEKIKRIDWKTWGVMVNKKSK